MLLHVFLVSNCLPLFLIAVRERGFSILSIVFYKRHACFYVISMAYFRKYTQAFSETFSKNLQNRKKHNWKINRLMELEKYLDSRNISQKEFASMLGVSIGSISKYIAARQLPRLDIAYYIEKTTKGNVSMLDLLQFWEKHKSTHDRDKD